MLNIDAESGLPPKFFLGREHQLRWFEKTVFSREQWYRPIVVKGPRGSGKTAIVQTFLHANQDRVRWLMWHGQFATNKASVNSFLKEVEKVSKSKDDRRLIVVIDDAELAGEEVVRTTVAKILNWKVVQAVIVSGIRTFAFAESPVLELSSLSNREAQSIINKVIGELPEELLTEVIIRARGNVRLLLTFANAAKQGGVEALKEYLREPLYDLNEAVPVGTLFEAVTPSIVFVADGLIDALKKEPASLYTLPPRKFEELLAQLLESLGMKVELTQASKDGGCDIIARLNTELGRFLCIVEAKRYAKENKVGVEIVKQLYATLCDKEATSAMLITTSSFTRGAKEFQNRFEHKLSLREYADVVRWIQAYKKDNKTGLYLPD